MKATPPTVWPDANHALQLRLSDAAPSPIRNRQTPAYDRGHFLLTMLWSNDPEIVRRADLAGIDRIGLDLEILNKAERQGGLNTWVSSHHEDQLSTLRQVVTRGELFCRTNPVHDGIAGEIDRILERGVDVLMLPMFKTVGEVRRYVDLVNGRAKVVPLLEHRAAARIVEQIVRIPGIDGLHVGLTDLSLSLGKRNRFGLLTSNLVRRIADAAHGEGLRLCIGGIGRAMDNDQPIPADSIYAQYPRLGASGALLSRAFFGKDPSAVSVERFAGEVQACRERMHWWTSRPLTEWETARQALVEQVKTCNSW